MSTPLRHGQPWTDDEIQKLLQSIKRKDTLAQIAESHQRSVGGIRGRLRQLAADYYFNDNRPIDQIMRFTGLDKETIVDAISKRQYEINMKEKKNKVLVQSSIVKTTPPAEEKRESITSVLVEIREMMREMLAILKEKRSED
jgi:hypothetical protein